MEGDVNGGGGATIAMARGPALDQCMGTKIGVCAHGKADPFRVTQELGGSRSRHDPSMHEVYSAVGTVRVHNVTGKNS